MWRGMKPKVPLGAAVLQMNLTHSCVFPCTVGGWSGNPQSSLWGLGPLLCTLKTFNDLLININTDSINLYSFAVMCLLAVLLSGCCSENLTHYSLWYFGMCTQALSLSLYYPHNPFALCRVCGTSPWNDSFRPSAQLQKCKYHYKTGHCIHAPQARRRWNVLPFSNRITANMISWNGRGYCFYIFPFSLVYKAPSHLMNCQEWGVRFWLVGD